MSEVASRIAAARAGDQHEFSALTEPYRRELQVHCYRILGSVQDAEDLVQETLLRAWRRLETFEARASLRAWLYKIATNACLDALTRRPRRSLPTATHPPADPRRPFAPPRAEPIWLEPLPDDLLADASASPEARYALRESVTLAFLAALQALPPRQRAVLILSDVLDWRAREVAETLGVSVAAVNSALHRARATLAQHYHRAGARERLRAPTGDETRSLLDRYVRAWETADVAGLTALLKEDATLMMPPSPSWYRGRAAIGAFAEFALFGAAVFPGQGAGRWRLRATRANAQPAFVLYLRDEAGGVHRGAGVQVLALDDEGIADIASFNSPELVSRFRAPLELA